MAKKKSEYKTNGPSGQSFRLGNIKAASMGY